jgi:hypothetical protein
LTGAVGEFGSFRRISAQFRRMVESPAPADLSVISVFQALALAISTADVNEVKCLGRGLDASF